MSFLNVKEKWFPELQSNEPGVPIVLVGTQLDLRNDVRVGVLICSLHYQDHKLPTVPSEENQLSQLLKQHIVARLIISWTGNSCAVVLTSKVARKVHGA